MQLRTIWTSLAHETATRREPAVLCLAVDLWPTCWGPRMRGAAQEGLAGLLDASNVAKATRGACGTTVSRSARGTTRWLIRRPVHMCLTGSRPGLE